MKTVLYNGTIVADGETFIENGYLIMEDKIITEVGHGTPSCTEDAEQIDVQGNYILPGFIDVHIHGAMGKDLIEGTQEAVEAVSKNVIQDGCTSFMASLTVVSHEEMLGILDGFAKVEQPENGAHFLGVHSEGPYLSKDYKALMDERYLRDPSIKELDEMIAHSNHRLKIMTVAPEREGMKEFISYADKQAITVMIGHTNAKPCDVHMAVSEGAKGFTHLYNAMSQHLHREPGCVTGAMIEKNSYAELMCDGFHVDRDVVTATYQMFGAERLVIITDAMLGKDMPDGDYTFSGLNCYKEGKHVRVKETGRIAGSAFGMNYGAKHMMEFTGCSMNEIVQMACVNPSVIAQVADRKGTLAVGKDADVIVINKDFDVLSVYISGKEVVFDNKKE